MPSIINPAEVKEKVVPQISLEDKDTFDKLVVRDDIPDRAKQLLNNALDNVKFGESNPNYKIYQDRINIGLKKGFILQSSLSTSAKAFGKHLLKGIAFNQNPTFGESPEKAQEEMDKLKQVAPTASKLGEATGTIANLELGGRAIGGGINLAAKATGLPTKIAGLSESLPETSLVKNFGIPALEGTAGATKRGLSFGLASGAYGAMSEYNKGASASEIANAFLKDFETGTTWGLGMEYLLAGGKGAKEIMDFTAPRILTSYRQRISPETVLTYAKNRKEVKNLFGRGISNSVREISEDVNNQIRTYVEKKGAAPELIIKKMQQSGIKVNTKQITNVIDEEIKKLTEKANLGDKQAMFSINELRDFREKYVKSMLVDKGKLTRPIDLDATSIETAKNIAQRQALSSYEFTGIGKLPMLSSAFSKVASKIRELQSASAMAVEGGQKLAQNNASISRLADLQKMLNIDGVFGYLRPGIKPSQLVSKAKKLEQLGSKANIDEYKLLEELDKMVGTNILHKSKIINAAIELANPDLFSGAMTGRSLYGRGFIPGLFKSPALTPALITTGKFTGNAMDFLGKWAISPAIKTGYKYKVADELNERERKNSLRNKEQSDEQMTNNLKAYTNR